MVNNKRYKLDLFIFIVLSFHFFVVSPAIFINKFLAHALCIGVVFHIKKIRFEHFKWHEIGIFAIVNAYLTMAIFGYDLFVSDSMHLEPLLQLLSFVLAFIWTSYILQFFVYLLFSLENMANRNLKPFGKEGYWEKWLLLFIVIFMIFMIWHKAYYPAVMPPDSFEYLDGWYRGIYNSFRSPIYSFLINIVCTLAPTKPEVQWIVITQITVFSALLATVLMYFHKKGVLFRHILIPAGILPLIPSLGLNSIIILSDLSCGMSILWFSFVLVRILDEVIINERADKKQQLSLRLQLFVSLVLICFIRSNSFLVYFVMTPVLIFTFSARKKWKLFLVVILTIPTVVIIFSPIYNMLGVVSNPMSSYGKYYAAIHDMQATYYNDGKFSDETVGNLRKYVRRIDVPELAGVFRPDEVQHQASIYSYDLSGITMGEFVSMYAESFINNPIKMIRSMLTRFRPYWVIDTKGELYEVNYTAIHNFRPEQVWRKQSVELRGYIKPSKLTKIMDKYIQLMNLQIPATFVWRYGIWVSMLIISIMALIIKRQFIWLLAYLPVFVYLASLFLASGWPSYRYGLPVFLIGMFLPVLLLITNKKKEGKYYGQKQ